MIDSVRLVAIVVSLLAAVASPAFSQAPSEAQRAAIRSECRSDYEAHCSSIPPGGAASLECLQKNMSSLSSGCAGAVRAVGSPAEKAAEPETKPATAAPAMQAKPAAEPAAAPKAAATPAASAAKKPSSAEIAAIKSACRSDYPKVCAGVPTGGAAALQCLEKNKAKLSPACQTAVSAAVGGIAPATGAPAAAAGTAPAAATAAPTALVLRPMRPREVVFVMRSACGGDVRALCPGVQAGGGRIIECLASQAASLSPACKGVLSQFAR